MFLKSVCCYEKYAKYKLFIVALTVWTEIFCNSVRDEHLIAIKIYNINWFWNTLGAYILYVSIECILVSVAAIWGKLLSK